MSRSVFIEYRGQGFWAFDVVLKVFLKHLVDIAAPIITANPWLSETVYQWRVQTIVNDLGAELDEEWSDAQIQVVIGLINATCDVLKRRDIIPAEEIESWDLLDGEHIFARGLPELRTKPITNLGRAIISLLRGLLPPAPAGTWWWYGFEDQPETVRKAT